MCGRSAGGRRFAGTRRKRRYVRCDVPSAEGRFARKDAQRQRRCHRKDRRYLRRVVSGERRDGRMPVFFRRRTDADRCAAFREQDGARNQTCGVLLRSAFRALSYLCRGQYGRSERRRGHPFREELSGYPVEVDRGGRDEKLPDVGVFHRGAVHGLRQRQAAIGDDRPAERVAPCMGPPCGVEGHRIVRCGESQRKHLYLSQIGTDQGYSLALFARQ